jgi:hypothetical protein
VAWWPGEGNVGLEFDVDELDAEVEFWKKVVLPDVSRCAPSPSDANTSVIGGRRLLV